MEKNYTINKIVQMRIDGLKSAKVVKRMIEEKKLRAIDITEKKGSYKRYFIPESSLKDFLKGHQTTHNTKNRG